MSNKFKSFQKLLIFIKPFRIILKVNKIGTLILPNFLKDHINIKVCSLLDFRSDSHVSDRGPRFEEITQKLYEIILVKIILVGIIDQLER